MRIIDVVTFNGEYDLLEIRLNVLNDYVDEFIIVEAPTTFSGLPKPLYYEKEKSRYSSFQQKIKYFVINEAYTPEEIAQAESSPNTVGAAHWKHEFLQKESIKKALTHLDDDDIVFVGDCDEIWKPLNYLPLEDEPIKLPQIVYTYWLNNRSSEGWHGTLRVRYGLLKNAVLNHMRTFAIKEDGPPDCGWHFTSMGGYEEMKRKLKDSYTKETYASDVVMDNLEHNMAQNKDFLGRNFIYTLDESDWPQYLKDNREKYKHLLREYVDK